MYQYLTVINLKSFQLIEAVCCCYLWRTKNCFYCGPTERSPANMQQCSYEDDRTSTYS